MTREEAGKMALIMQAYADGKEVQAKNCTTGFWEVAPDPVFYRDAECYRIKPQPRVIWVNVYGDGELGGAWPTEADAKKCGGTNVQKNAKFIEVLE